jgi:hypothetical protein
VDATASGPPLQQLVATHGWIVETSRRVRTDLELVCHAGRGRFTARTDCRVLACFDEASVNGIDSRSAQVVLSRSGQLGSTEQIRLRLDDVDGLWKVLEGHKFAPRRVAA